MTANRMKNIFLFTASTFLGGCALTPVVDYNNCNKWDEGVARIPLLLEFNSKSGIVSDEPCKQGTMIGYSALIARQQDGSLHPASLITWHRHYQILLDKMKESPESIGLREIKNSADYSIKNGSQKFGQSLVTSEMAKAMFEKKTLDPALFNPDGTLIPTAKPCTGQGFFRNCSAPANGQVQPQ